MAETSWRERPIRMCRFDYVGEMIPDDAAFLEEHARLVRQELHANLEWVIGTPGAAPGLGYLANFQTDRFEVNPSLGQGDPIRTYVPIARRHGIAVFAYTNMHWFATAFADQHPGWEQVLADGQAYGRLHPLYGDGTTLCVNSGWRDFAFGMMEEAMKTGIDGIFLDGPVVYPGCCYCDACRARFRALHGADLPAEEDWNDPTWKAFMRFREQSMADFLRDAGEHIRAVRADGGVFCNAGNWPFGNAVARNPWALEGVQDLTGAEAFFHLRREGVPYLLDSAQSAKFLRAGSRPAVVFTHHALGVWHYVGLSPLELKRSFYQTAACGANNWFAVFAPAVERQREKTLAPVREAYGFLEAHEELFTGAVSAARTALVHSQTSSFAYCSARAAGQAEAEERDLIMHTRQATPADTRERKRASDHLLGEEFAGFFYALTRTHVPFDVLRDADLEEERLARYDQVILPNAACLSAAQGAALLAYARAGGKVIGTFETGVYDEAGEPAGDDFRRALFGVESTAGAFAPAAFEEYLQIAPAGAALLPGYVEGELVPRPRAALKVKAAPGVRVLARVMEPIGRVYAPPRGVSEWPAILVQEVGDGLAAYVAGTMAESYQAFGTLEFEQILGALCRSLPGDEPQLETDAPSTVQMELWLKGSQVLLHLVNNSGDMRRPMAHIHPVERLQIRLPGGEIAGARSLRGEAVEWETDGEQGTRLALSLRSQYDIVVLDLPD
ncbi:MAG: alpha-amylase family protein [Gemmatimonadota bacterium]